MGHNQRIDPIPQSYLRPFARSLRVLRDYYDEILQYVHPWYEQTEGPRVGVSEDDDGYPE